MSRGGMEMCFWKEMMLSLLKCMSMFMFYCIYLFIILLSQVKATCLKNLTIIKKHILIELR